MRKGFSKIETLVTTSMMLAVAAQFLGYVQEKKDLVLEEWAKVTIRYENVISEIEDEEHGDIRDEIIRKLVLALELSEEEKAYIRAKDFEQEAETET
jgi:hypothetical protein